jgi:ABC-type ATPase involved in cell division
MVDPVVAFDGVSLESTEGRPVFADLHWNVPKGARVRIAAERGEGGTAILRLCAGLAHPHKGRVLLDGVPHAPDRFDHPYLRRGALGWIPQEGGHVANLSLLQNVALPLRFVSGKPREEAEASSLAVLRALGLGERAHQRPYALLRRERHLGALARAVVMGAELWLWDRPLDELEPEDLARVLDVMGEILRVPSTTILVVGDEPLCETFTSTVVRLEGGRLIAEGET